MYIKAPYMTQTPHGDAEVSTGLLFNGHNVMQDLCLVPRGRSQVWMRRMSRGLSIYLGELILTKMRK